jgi:hypothetical protein
MSTIVQCKQCNKKIEVPDKARGHRIKCPACAHIIQVDPPSPETDELRLAPLDENEENVRKQLLAERLEITESIFQEKPAPVESQTDDTDSPTESPTSEKTKNLRAAIIQYIRFMADGELDKAALLGKKIMVLGKSALPIIDELALNNAPETELADLPPQVLSGLIRTLRGKII